MPTNPAHNKFSDKKTKNSRGFTLIELLIVITIIGILAGLMVAVLNAKQHMGDTRNARRKLEVHTLASAINQYEIDKGELAAVPDTSTEICAQDAADCSGYVDLSTLLNNQTYLTKIPSDPQNTDENGTGYFVHRTEFDRIVVRAGLAENGEVIEIMR